MAHKPWLQLGFVLGEVALTIVSGGVLFIVISRTAGPEFLGAYALALAWLTLFQGVSSFGIPEYLMREVGTFGRAANEQVVHAIALGLGSGFVALCLMLGSVRLLGYSSPIVQAISIASLALIPAFLNIACRSVFLALRQMHLTFFALLVEVTIVMSVSLILLLSGYGVIALMISLVFSKVASASISLALLFGRVMPARPSIDPGILIKTARTIFAFGIGNMLGMLTMRINTIMVSIWADIATVGHFAAATKVMELGLIVPALMPQLLMTRIAYSFNAEGSRDPNRFGGWYQVLFALVLPICVGVWVFAAPILNLLFGPGFKSGLWILRILMLYLAIESADAMMSVILRASHRQRQDVWRLAFNPLVNIALNLLLLPTIGTIGAAIGRVGGAVASAALRNQLIASELTAVNWFGYALKPGAISIGVGSVCALAGNADRSIWLLPVYAVATGGLVKIASGFSFAVIKDMMNFPSQD